MVGEGVLHEFLQHPEVSQVLVVNRRSCGQAHTKLSELLVPDFFNLESIESKLSPFDACLFCMGVSSIGKSPEEYKRITYDLTLHWAGLLARENPGMTFCYVSGAGTDSTEQGRLRWARVKGKTENDLTKLPFKAVYNFRPGYLQPTPGLKRAYKAYRYAAPFYPVLRTLFPSKVTTLAELGQAMLKVCLSGYPKTILECRDIVGAARSHTAY